MLAHKVLTADVNIIILLNATYQCGAELRRENGQLSDTQHTSVSFVAVPCEVFPCDDAEDLHQHM
jgi:hypothetical protein